MEGLYLHDCVCDACDREGRYHMVSQDKYNPPQKPGPDWGLILLVVILAGVVFLFLNGLK